MRTEKMQQCEVPGTAHDRILVQCELRFRGNKNATLHHKYSKYLHLEFIHPPAFSVIVGSSFAMGLCITPSYTQCCCHQYLVVYGAFFLPPLNAVFTSEILQIPTCQYSHMKQSGPHKTKAMLVQFSWSVSRANEKETLSYTICISLMTEQ